MTAAFHRPSAFSVSGDLIGSFTDFVCNEICAEWFSCVLPEFPNLLPSSTVTPGAQATQEPLLDSILTHTNHVFHGEMILIVCTWPEISTYSLVSLLKNTKHLINNLFPQQKNYDWLKPHCTVHTQVVLLGREQMETRNCTKRVISKYGLFRS